MQVSVLPRCSSVSAVLDAHSLSEALQVSLETALIVLQCIDRHQKLVVAVIPAAVPRSVHLSVLQLVVTACMLAADDVHVPKMQCTSVFH